ncbi:hypothetical protein B0H14DRAFT_2569506 [Mycena olivaceomarginata]|nr:hypothetical protein B0H14DRAFT_2569506 [Mycena olivaceomarginata]
MDELEGFDLGEPIICEEYDLEEALKRENEARLAREASGAVSEEDELEVEEATGLNARREKPAPPPQPTAAASQPLTGREKKKQQNRARQRAKRKADTVASLSSISPPLPSPRVLQKATESIPLSISFSADGFRATKQRWTGLTSPLEHPLLPHADEPDILKKHMRYNRLERRARTIPFLWRALLADTFHRKCHLILDRKRRIIGILVPPPVHPDQWAPVVEAATAAMPPAAIAGGNFPSETDGFAFGGGRQTVGNIKQRSGQNRAALEDLLQDKNIERMATYPIPVFQAACFQIFSDYHRTKQALLRKNPYLRPTFPRSPFAAVTVNLGPASVSPPHADGANKADGMCLVGALGRALCCWDYDLIIRFPAGCSILIPSAVVTHSNTPIQAGEERYSIIQYSAGALFRWVANGFQTDIQWHAHATADDVAAREADRRTRCATALKKFSRWKDLKVKNFSGRHRVEVWDEGEVADFSDLTEEESEPEAPPPKKKARCA